MRFDAQMPRKNSSSGSRLARLARAGGPARKAERRASVMIFVLGVLSLLALVGLAMMTKTHGEFLRVNIQSAGMSTEAIRDGLVRQVRERLRQDVWGSTGPTRFGHPLNDRRGGSLEERNEPWDAPGESDRWLSSLTPYYIGGQLPFDDATVEEPDILVWRYVSYLGRDLLRQPSRSPFRWADHSRKDNPLPTTPMPVTYSDDNLSNVKVIQTPPPAFTGLSMIPGSTTNVTISEARDLWNSQAHQDLLAESLILAPSNVGLKFPYFDTNADGEVDLYDADGDGIPDSPLSFFVETDSPDRNRPRQLYAAVRIVDHAAMSNVNTAFSMDTVGDNRRFGESGPDFQRRGRRVTEFLLDDVVHFSDRFVDAGGSNRTANLVDYRSQAAASPLFHDIDVVRRKLAGGVSDFGLQSLLYGMGDEASLRHRNLLVPYDRRGDDDPVYMDDYSNVDRALRGTALWSRAMVNDAYTGAPRWARLNANFNDPLGAYEGDTDGGGVGWRKQLDEDEPYAVRRPLLTTTNVAVVPPPDITSPSVISGQLDPIDFETSVELRLRRLRSLGMNWPVLIESDSPLDGWIANNQLDPIGLCGGCSLTHKFIIDGPLPPEWARVHPVDLNMSLPNNRWVQAKADFIRYSAAAMYLALDGVREYQGLPLRNSALLNREYLAWQFAVNLADYRDSDNEPTILEWPTQPNRFIFGVEKQPFFTEAFVHLTVERDANGEIIPDSETWFNAFELYVPPGWNIPTEHLYFRTPPSKTLISLNTFLQVTNGSNLAVSGMDGGEVDFQATGDPVPPFVPDHGNYYVFCNDPEPNLAPAAVRNSQNFMVRAYHNNALTIPHDGSGRLELVYSPDNNPDNPRNHVLDVIGAPYFGGTLSPTSEDEVQHPWAQMPPNFIAPSTEFSFSLRRSTKGWRFTTAWHQYSTRPASRGGVEFEQSLGRPNGMRQQAILRDLDANIPESIWPAITAVEPPGDDWSPGRREPRFADRFGDPALGFASGMPYEAFDSVADLSRMFMIGPTNLSTEPIERRPAFLADEPVHMDLPVTALIAETIRPEAITLCDLPEKKTTGNSEDAIYAGRVDLVNACPLAGSTDPWTWRLFDYFTTRSHLFDAVDNDGDGMMDLDDPTEAADVLFRHAGRVNINTAPATVLRSGPFMSLLPTSAEYVKAVGGLTVSPAEAYEQDIGLFWDFAAAIVAIRENRDVDIRLRDGMGNLVPVATAGQSGGPSSFGSPSAQKAEPFEKVIGLAALHRDGFGNPKLREQVRGQHDMFLVDRFWSESQLALNNHSIQGAAGNIEHALDITGTGSPLSPDFRYRRDNRTSDYVPIRHVAGSTALPDAVQGNPADSGGIRGRDVLLSRWTNIYGTRSDTFTAYIVLIDEDGNYVHRSQVTLDRSVCFQERPSSQGGRAILPQILVRTDGSYTNDTR